MHREIDHTNPAFHEESNLSLYLFTLLLGGLLLADLGPPLALWLRGWGLELPTWQREIYGYRFALLAAILGGARVAYTSLDALLAGRLGADLAMTLACIAAILIGEPLVAAEIVFIGLLGECLESITFARTQRALRHAVEVFPRRCWLLRDGQEVRVRTEELQVGDHVVVKPGGRIPVDGVVLEGRSAVDTSALTGESLPMDKGPGDEVLAGSVNQFGALTIEAQRVAEQTVAGRVMEMTARALKDKATLERTADLMARWFLPAVLSLAALTFLVNLGYRWLTFRPELGRFGQAEVVRSVYPALSVLVVACPCALILATPAAIIAALGRLAGTGILLKSGAALERLAGVTAFAFDKTGTLTEGRLELGDVLPLPGIAPEELLRVAASAEQPSEHLLARLILQEAEQRALALEPIEDFQAHPGAGVTGQIGGQRVVVGTRRLLEEQGLAIPDEADALLRQLDGGGQTALLVAREGKILGVVGARDRIRPEAGGVLQDLRALGIADIALLTGDRRAAAERVAAELGLTEVRAELLPEDKAAFVKEWRQQGRRVAMVGDGINDAPGLAVADVGLALGGTDLAVEAGDVVFLGDPLRPLPLLLRLSRETVRIIRQNIVVFAFGVNLAGIVLTAWLWPLFAPTAQWYEQSPVIAVLYHQLGSLAVLLNSMRLLWFDRARTSPTWQRLQRWLVSVDSGLDRYFNVEEGLHWLTHHFVPVMAVLAVLALLAWSMSGLTVVGPDEVAVVRRFGRPLDDDLGPGLHWRRPWPIETVTRLQPDRIRILEVGFRSAASVAVDVGSLSWASAHGSGIERVPGEAVLITGDGNLVELQATVRYTIAEPRVYLFDVRDPEVLLRAATEAVLRESVAGRPFLELLTVQRDGFQRQVLARLEQRCRTAGPNGLGIRLDGVSLHDLHPPQEVVAAYHDVARAMEARDRQVNDAQAEASRRKYAAEGAALRLVREAQADAFERVQQAATARDIFLLRQQARTQLSWSDEGRLFWQTLALPEAERDPAAAYAKYQRSRQDQLRTQAFLTDFRLTWQVVIRILGGRDKVIVDADRLPGRRHLLLFDPDTFRVPVPVLTPPERAPR